ncbi:MFS transporter [Cellulomonas soli]|uniref:MFS transporter n=1 Tax=Cellulomonas soli TaxID=931535 RepID=A0A512PG20_9CELL|nr:MFS transporter [Cellulomonas soli]NYI59717.1 MFS family permease [Cellulomonas soli]GEP70140.1 MFS transporter [Cellulomonas soli]
MRPADAAPTLDRAGHERPDDAGNEGEHASHDGSAPDACTHPPTSSGRRLTPTDAATVEAARAARAARSARSTRVSSTVVTIGVVSLLTDISSESVAAILPLYLTTALGMTTLAYGFVDGLMQGATALVRIGGGWASDRGDHPKWVAFAGYGLSALTRVGLLLTTGFVAITSLVAVDRLGKGLRTSPRDAMIAASSNPRNLGRSFGVHRMLDTVGAAVGPLLAFVVLWLLPDGYHTVFVISFGSAVIGLAVLGLLVPDLRPRQASWLTTHQSRAERKLPSCKGCSCSDGAVPALTERPFSWRFLAEPGLRRVLVVSGVLALLTIGDGFIYLSLQERDGFATKWFPLLYVGTNVAYMLLAIPAGRLADRVGRARVFVWGHAMLGAAYVCAAFGGASAVTTLAALLLLGAFYAGTDGVLAAVVGQRTAPQVRASAIGTAQTVVAVARMAASAAFGVLWYTLGRQPAIVCVAVLLAVALPACWFALRHLDHPAGLVPDTASETDAVVTAP